MPLDDRAPSFKTASERLRRACPGHDEREVRHVPREERARREAEIKAALEELQSCVKPEKDPIRWAPGQVRSDEEGRVVPRWGRPRRLGRDP